MKAFNSIWLWASLLILAACGGNIDLDNGGEEDLKVVIGDAVYDMEAGSRRRIKLKKGPHRIQVVDYKGDIIRDTSFAVVKGGLINLAGADYLIWRDIFSPKSTLALRKQMLKTRKLLIEKQTYEIEYEEVPKETLYIEQYWDYGLEQSFPKQVYGWELEKDKKYMFKTKLVRKDQFSQIYLDATRN